MKRDITVFAIIVFVIAGGGYWLYTSFPPLQRNAGIAAYNRRIYWHPKNGLLYWRRARAYERMGNDRAALADYNKAIPLFSDSRNYWDSPFMWFLSRRLISLQSEALRYKRAQLRLEFKQYDLAIADCNLCLAHHPGAIPELLLRAETYQAKGETQKAIADFTGVVTSGITDYNCEAYTGRGETYAALKDFAKAEADLDKAIKIDTDTVPARLCRASVRCDQGVFDGAIADCNRVIQVDPDDAAAFNVRAKVWFKKGAVEKASADVAACRKLGGKPDPALVSEIAAAHRPVAKRQAGAS